jgi:hypothetical protein
MPDLYLLTRRCGNKHSHKNKHRGTVFHIFYYSSNLIDKAGSIISLMANT